MPRPFANPRGMPSAGPRSWVSWTMFPGTSRNEVVIPASPRPTFRTAVWAQTGVAASAITRATIARTSELREHRLGAADVQPRSGLDVELLDPAVLHHHAITLRALAHAEAARVELEPDGTRELPVAAGEHPHLPRRARGLPPGVHHEDVVHGHADDVVDALPADLLGVRDEPREVLLRARGREGAGDREEDHAASLEYVAERDVLRSTLLHLLQPEIQRQHVADLDRHVASSRFECGRPM